MYKYSCVWFLFLLQGGYIAILDVELYVYTGSRADKHRPQTKRQTDGSGWTSKLRIKRSPRPRYGLRRVSEYLRRVYFKQQISTVFTVNAAVQVPLLLLLLVLATATSAKTHQWEVGIVLELSPEVWLLWTEYTMCGLIQVHCDATTIRITRRISNIAPVRQPHFTVLSVKVNIQLVCVGQ